MFKKIAVIIKKIRAIRVIRVQKKSLLSLKKIRVIRVIRVQKKSLLSLKKFRAIRELFVFKKQEKKAQSVLHIYAFSPLFLAAFSKCPTYDLKVPL